MIASADGSLVDAHGRVHWRVGAVPRSAQSSTALDWVRELVDAHGVVAPAGFAARSGRAKPRFAGATDADFSVSHSGGLLLVAVSHIGPIGVDIEAEPFDAFENATLAQRACTPAELTEYASLAGADRPRYLARLWTAKEARAKATGVGLTVDFRTRPAHLADERHILTRDDLLAAICIARVDGPAWRLAPHVASRGGS